MTVPTLMNNTNANEFRSAFKKSISAVNQALTLNYSLEGLSANDYTAAKDLVQDVFKKRMSVIDGETSFTTTNCGGASKDTVFTTSDGMIFCVSDNYFSNASDEHNVPCDSYNTQPCVTNIATANLWIDVNGVKKPNKATVSATRPRDVYQAQIYAQKVIPFGAPAQHMFFEKGTTNTSANNGEDVNNDPNKPLDCSVSFDANGKPVMTCK